jgi:hypothetical protein
MNTKHSRILALLITVILNGCVSLPVIPENSMPLVNKPEIYTPFSPSIRVLDCLNGLLAKEKATIRLSVGPVPNEFGSQTSGINFPQTLKPFIENSLSRITNVYQLYDSEHFLAIQGVTHKLAGFGAASEAITKEAVLGDVINVDFLVTGSLYVAQEIKSASATAEAIVLGINGEVKAFDATAQLQVIDAKTRRKVLSTALILRLYKAIQGATFFKITDGSEIIQSEASFNRAPSVGQGLQFLSDSLVAAMIRDLSSAILRKSYSSCHGEIAGIDHSRLPVQASSNHTPTYKLRIVKTDGEVCVGGEAISRENQDEKVQIIFRQFASSIALNIPIDKTYRSAVKASKLTEGTLCLSKSLLDENAQNIEVEVMNAKNESLGIVAGSL